MSLAILGIGTAVPSGRENQDTALRVAQVVCCESQEQKTWLPDIYQGSEIETRHIVFSGQVATDVLEGTRKSGSVFLPKGVPGDTGPTTQERNQVYREQAFPVALQAARHAIEDANIDPAAFTHLVTVSCTGFHAPGVDIQLIRSLGLPATIQRTHIGFMGCHGALNGLRVARAFVDAEESASVLVCAVELCSIHYHYGWEPGAMIANAIFADGAAALVGVSAAQAPAGAWRVAASGSYLFPNTEGAMSWTIGDHGFEMTLSRKVPSLIQAHLRPWLENWLRKQNLNIDDIASWAIHPGGPRIIAAAQDALGLSRHQTAVARQVFAEFGNMSSATILFILERLRTRNAPRPCVALGFGPGLVVEAALVV